MLEKTDTESTLQLNPQQKKRIHPMFLGVIMGLFLLLVRLIFKDTSLDKKQRTQKQDSVPAPFTGNNDFQPSFSHSPVGQSGTAHSVQPASFQSSGINQGRERLHYPPSGSSAMAISTAPPSAIDVMPLTL